jgi:hypothetical protein
MNYSKVIVINTCAAFMNGIDISSIQAKYGGLLRNFLHGVASASGVNSQYQSSPGETSD